MSQTKYIRVYDWKKWECKPQNLKLTIFRIKRAFCSLYFESFPKYFKVTSELTIFINLIVYNQTCLKITWNCKNREKQMRKRSYRSKNECRRSKEKIGFLTRKDQWFQYQEIWKEFERIYTTIVRIERKMETVAQRNEINVVKDIIGQK